MKGRKFIPLLVVGAGLLAYQNSFTGAFVSDDRGSILENPSIRHLWPMWRCLSPPHWGGLTVEGRPLINLSLAINYALGGYNVWGYHALNLAVHILAGLTLLGLVRRTLLQPALRDRFGAAAGELALATAVLWTVHPLQTESVTYLIQRAESITGLFYLLTLYCLIRGVGSHGSRIWYGLSVIACALGMASKEVMVSAPLMVLLYDRAFLCDSFRDLWRRRWPLYLALASTWIILVLVLVFGGVFGPGSMSAQRTTHTWWQYLVTLSSVPLQIRGTQRIGFTWWQYLAAQPGVILYYLRLSVWPFPLCLDRGWPIPTSWVSILSPAVLMAVLLGATAWAWTTNRVWGFVGAWFFLILAPSSSFIPVLDMIHEHRMYLPLAAVISAMVMGLYSLAGRHSLAVFIVVAIGLGFLTWRRNLDYHGEFAIRADAVAKFPNDPVVHYNLGGALVQLGRVTEAIGQFNQALRLKPDYVEAHNSLGNVLLGLGKAQEAVEHYEQALRFKPDYAETHYNLAVALNGLGQTQEAIEHDRQALRLRPNFAEAHKNLAVALEQVGRVHEAIRHYEEALRIKPDYVDAHNDLGGALAQLGKMQEAVGHWEQALRIKPDYAEAHYNMGVALAQAGKVEEAIGHLEQALRNEPTDAMTHYNLGVCLEQAGQVREAKGHYEQALRLKPDFAEAQKALAQLRATQ